MTYDTVRYHSLEGRNVLITGGASGIGEAIARIRAQVGAGRVLCGLSGGVDSSVAAVLIHEAIGDQLTCVFVDHGLMRLGEAELREGTFTGAERVTLAWPRHRRRPTLAEVLRMALGAQSGQEPPAAGRRTSAPLLAAASGVLAL